MLLHRTRTGLGLSLSTLVFLLLPLGIAGAGAPAQSPEGSAPRIAASVSPGESLGGGDILWTTTLGGASYDEGYDLIATADGGYLIGGSSQSFGSAARSAYLIKTDAQGNQLWYQTYAHGSMAYVHGVAATSDGGYILAGHDYSSSTDWDVYLIKTDAAGNALWEETYGGTGLDFGYSVIEMRDGGFAVAGVTLSFGAGSYDVYVVKAGPNGALEWSQTYGGMEEEFGYDLCATADGGLAIVGFTDTFSQGNAEYAVYLVKTDAAGVEQWSKTYGEEHLNRGYSIRVVPETGFVIAGHEGGDACLIRTDAQGNQQWSRTFGGTSDEEFKDVNLTEDCGYIMTGYTRSFGGGGKDLYVVKTDPAGNEVWSQHAGGGDDDYGEGIIQDGGDHYVAVGCTKTFGPGYEGIYLIKLDSAAYPLGTDAGALSASAGGVASFTLDAGAANAGRTYILFGGATGTEPGTLLPGGLATIPINRDKVTDFLIQQINTSIARRFAGRLDAQGAAAAELHTFNLLGPGLVGRTLHFAYALVNPWDFASNAVGIEIVP